jgi:signal transduction histidine kinase
MLEGVLKATRRAADLVQQILSNAGKGRFVIQPVDLSSLVRDMEGLLRAAVSKQAELRFELPADPSPVQADATQLRQVVMNLVTNASEAVGESGGTITVRTGLIQADQQARRPSPPKVDLPGAVGFPGGC